MSSHAQLTFAPRDHSSRRFRAPETHTFAPQYAPVRPREASVSWSRRVRALIWISATILSWAFFALLVQGVSSISF